ncbi:hypothetical protein ACSBPU_09010 [Parapusillimonas sp. JC17]|uniref:hypothetical protein n=1 Tax=Parapusillimonas sp. JC17 TaxID=3445768 RepID=UPI003F9F6F48
MQRALSFNNSPRLGVPLRFLINTPLFVLLAALLLLWAGPSALGSRWTGHALALTHLFTLGVLASAMIGAMMQILPVATGINMLAPRATSIATHLLLTVGTLGLAAGFLTVNPALFQLAILLLGGAFAWLLISGFCGLWRDRRQATKGSTEILVATRLALAALLVTVVMGLLLAASFVWPLPVSRLFTDLHSAWGLLGWVGLLVMGMSYQVIPMFQVTELYPKVLTRWLAIVVFVLLLAFGANLLRDPLGGVEIGYTLAILLLLAYGVYAYATFRLLWTRKRPQADTTTRFWHTAVFCLAACIPVWLAQIIMGSDLAVTLGVLFIVGFAWSAVNGMLYKILPFLLWYNAQRDLDVALREVPKVKQILPDDMAARQYWVHLAAVATLVAASLWPADFTRPAALLLAVSALWLAANMARALLFYRRALKNIARALAVRDGQGVGPHAGSDPR